jgi:hypothetical protein
MIQIGKQNMLYYYFTIKMVQFHKTAFLTRQASLLVKKNGGLHS